MWPNRTYNQFKHLEDADGWVDASKYKPHDYDLVELMMENKIKRTGWWTGNSWFYRKYKLNEKVILWRKTRTI